ncbi:hypothetical protein ACWIT3_04420 [Pasteurella sp. P03HT]
MFDSIKEILVGAVKENATGVLLAVVAIATMLLITESAKSSIEG